MNLIVVDKCTNNCSYCFASTEMSQSTARNELSREAIEEVLAFVRRSGPSFSLNIIGGEPFLFHDLGYFLEKLSAEPALAQAIVFTGGIFSTVALERLSPFAERIALLFNLNERRDYRRDAEYEVVLRNMKEALKLGLRLNVGFNIWRADFNYQEILNVCRDFGVEYLRWTVAFPEAEPMPGVITLPPSAYKDLARRCFSFMEAAYQMGIQAYLDCPLPKCFFTPEELGRILLIQPRSATAIRACGPAVDVGPDLTVFRCYALSGHARRNLKEFSNYSDLSAWFERAIDDRYERPQVFEACATCEFAADRSCYGGCMAHSVISIGQRPPVQELLRQAHQALSSGQHENALSILEKLPREDATVALLRAHLFLEMGQITEALRWARLAVNRSRATATRRRATDLLNALESVSPSEHHDEDGAARPRRGLKTPIELPVLTTPFQP
jgi:radical SAM protein with 4Fe4S-binding SPASM domain